MHAIDLAKNIPARAGVDNQQFCAVLGTLELKMEMEGEKGFDANKGVRTVGPNAF